MAYTISAKPKMQDFMLRQQGDFLLLQCGGRIMIRDKWKKVVEQTASWTKVAKPAIP